MNHEEQLEQICRPEFTRIAEAQEKQGQDIVTILCLLQGANGSPGFLERVRRIEDCQEQTALMVKGHHHALFGEGKEKSGLVDDMRDQQRRNAKADKLTWAAIVVILGNLGAWIWGFFK